jgi:hypothetical protein
MSPTSVKERAEWIGVCEAARIAGFSEYSIQKFALARMVRTKTRPPFQISYHRGDVEALALALGGSSAPEMSGGMSAPLRG